MRCLGCAPQRRPCVLPPPCLDGAVAPVSGDRKDPKATLLLIVSTANEELSQNSLRNCQTQIGSFSSFSSKKYKYKVGEIANINRCRILAVLTDIFTCLLAPCLFDGPRAGILESLQMNNQKITEFPKISGNRQIQYNAPKVVVWQVWNLHLQVQFRHGFQKYHEICESQFRSWLSLVETNFYPPKNRSAGTHVVHHRTIPNHRPSPARRPRAHRDTPWSFAAFLLTHFKKSLAQNDTKVDSSEGENCETCESQTKSIEDPEIR